MKRPRFLLFLLFLSITATIGYILYVKNGEPLVHYHAGFYVYAGGVKQDLSDIRYMHVAPCNDEAGTHEEDDQLEKAHLHDNVGDVVHVHRNGATWGDLFRNIHYTFPEGVSLAGYVNGNKVENILIYPIDAYDSVLFIAGNAEGVDLTQTITKEYIRSVESKSETCGE